MRSTFYDNFVYISHPTFSNDYNTYEKICYVYSTRIVSLTYLFLETGLQIRWHYVSTHYTKNYLYY